MYLEYLAQKHTGLLTSVDLRASKSILISKMSSTLQVKFVLSAGGVGTTFSENTLPRCAMSALPNKLDQKIEIELRV
jgi:hypothetical protein